jgi:pimeloyl-ACP methyl ester carboxylesterase
MARQDGPTVPVGHSFSGMIVTEAGVHPNVSAFVYVAAQGPSEIRRRESDRGLKSTILVSGRRVPMLASSLKRFDSTRLRQFARTEAAPAHYLLIVACFAAGHADYRPVSYNRKGIPDDDQNKARSRGAAFAPNRACGRRGKQEAPPP